MDNDKSQYAYTLAATTCWVAFGLGTLVAGALAFMFVIVSLWQILIGLGKCGLALWTFEFSGPEGAILQGGHNSEMLILNGLELLLLAPLPFLLLSSLAAVVGEWGEGKCTSEATHKRLHEAKNLLYGSFFALLCLDFIAKEISNTIVFLDGTLEIAGLILMALFILFLEKRAMCDKNSKSSNATPHENAESQEKSEKSSVM